MAESSSQRGPIAHSILVVVLVVLVLFVAKIYLRAPEYRHVEVCYLPHKVFHFVWVDAWGMFVPDDSASYLSHSRDVSNFFFSCSQEASDWDWLRSVGTHQ